MNRVKLEVAITAALIRRPYWASEIEGFGPKWFTDPLLRRVTGWCLGAVRNGVAVPVAQMRAELAKTGREIDFDQLTSMDVDLPGFRQAVADLRNLLGPTGVEAPRGQEISGAGEARGAGTGGDSPLPPEDAPTDQKNGHSDDGPPPGHPAAGRSRSQPQQAAKRDLWNYDAEQALLGAVLANKGVFIKCQGLVRAEDFADALHGRIWDACGDIVAKGGEPSPINLHQRLATDGGFADVEGGARGYLIALAQAVVTVLHADDYARTVADLAARRRLKATLESIEAELYRTDNEAPAIIAKATGELTGAMGMASSDIKTKLELRQELADYVSKPGKFYSTGIAGIDRMLGGGLFAGKLVGLAARKKQGKAQPLSSLVLTRRGWKTMGRVRLGERLASIDGRESVVTGIFPQGALPVYTVTFWDGRIAKCSGDHLWTIEGYRGKGWETVDTVELQRRSKQSLPIYVPFYRGDDRPNAKLEIHPYALGALIGDGGLTHNSPMFSTADDDMLKALAHFLPGMELRKAATRGYDYRIVATGARRGKANPLTVSLTRLGLMGKGSHEKAIPLCYMEASRAQRLDLVRGLLDTDGYTSGVNIEYCTTSHVLAVQFRSLIWSLGGMCRIAEKKAYATKNGVRTRGRVAYRCHVRHPDSRSLFLLQRKYQAAAAIRRHECRLTVKSVELSGYEECQCIKVSHPSELYVTDNYVMTHNTSLVGTISHNLDAAGTPHGFAALEMSGFEIEMRDVARDLQVNTLRLMLGTRSQAAIDPQRVIDTMPALNNVTYYLSRPNATISDIRAFALQITHRYQAKVLIVDYHQLLEREDMNQNEEQHLRATAQALAGLARQLDIAILLCLQLNQEGNSRGGEGIKLACDAYVTLHRDKGMEGAWLDLEETRYLPHFKLGSETSPALKLDPHGPHFVPAGPDEETPIDAELPL